MFRIKFNNSTLKKGDLITLSYNLNIPEKAFTTKEESRIIEKRIVLNNKWKIISEINKTKVSYINNQTVINVSCQHGQPVKIKATSNL